MDKIKLAIIDDDLNWIKEIVKFLNREEDIVVTGTASNRNEALKFVDSTNIDIILMDVNLTENKHDGIDVAIELLNKCKAKIIMLSAININDVICSSFTAGAVNYISKTNFRELPAAIRNTYKGVSPIEALARDYTRLRKEEQLGVLTSAEKEVFRLIEEGYTKSQITEKLHKTESTLKNQISQILKKLGVKNSKEAIRKFGIKGLFKK